MSGGNGDSIGRMKRWTDVSDDPNSPAALQFRRQTLAAARRPPVPDRTAYLQDLCRGRRVLDVGVVDHTVDSGQPLHRAVASVAGYCLGVDILEGPVNRLREQGFNVRKCDITRDDVGEQFDVMVVGEVIEHLGNPAGLFAAGGRVLSPGGRMVLTTPNPFYMARARDNLRGRCFDSVDHVTYLFPSGIAELAEREGLRLDAYRGVKVSKDQAGSFGGRMMLRLHGMLSGGVLAPEAACETMIYECVKPT